MKAGSKIVVGVDGSERAAGVIASAVELAKAFAAELILVRAVTIPIEIPAEAFMVTPDRMLEILETNARESLDARARDLPKGVKARSVVRTGAAWQVVCFVAREVDADLIIIGSHGYSGFDRILGTNAERVIDHADRSVLVVRDHTHKKEAAHV